MNDDKLSTLSNAGLLLCFECGYDLRGLQAPSILCPECGTPNNSADLVSASVLTQEGCWKSDRELGRCITNSYFVVITLTFVLLGFGKWALILLIFSLAAWLYSGWKFGKAHQFNKGWFHVLGHSSVVMILIGVVVVIEIIGCRALTHFVRYDASKATGGFSSLFVFLLLISVNWIVFRKFRHDSAYNPFFYAKRRLWLLSRATLLKQSNGLEKKSAAVNIITGR